MAVSEELVASVVTDTSERMKDSQFAQIAVGNFVQSHPAVAKYITATMTRKVDGEAAVTTVFHAELICECLRRHKGVGGLVSVGFEDLNQVSGEDPVGRLAKKEPAIASYIGSNIDDEPTREVLALVALALVRAAL